MPADRLNFYLQRKQKTLQAIYQSVTNTATTNWTHIAARQASLKEELKVLEKLISISRQSVYQSTHNR